MDIDQQPATGPAWLPAFEAEIAAAGRRAFAWGEHDCVTFAARCWHARTGTDALAGFTWGSQAEAEALLAELGGLRAAVVSRLGEPVAPLLAAMGDVVLARDPHADDGREVLAVCVGPHLVVPSARGRQVLQLAHGVCCWKAEVAHG